MDGLQLTHGGTVRGFRFVCLEDRSLVADAIAEKRQRQMVRAANERRWS